MIINSYSHYHVIAIFSKNDMPDDSESGYVTSASSTINTDWAAYKAFDGSTDYGTNHVWGGNNVPQWLQQQLPAAKTLTQYKLKSFNNANVQSMPKTWTMLGSNTGAFAGEQVTLDTQTTVADWAQNETRTYNITNTTAYLYYRINTTVIQAGTNVFIGELELYGY